MSNVHVLFSYCEEGKDQFDKEINNDWDGNL
jgi:hypothetical protein